MSTSDGNEYFFPSNSFSDVIFFKFYSTKRRSKRTKLCKKKIGHQPRLGENSSSHSSQVGHLARARFRGESFPKVLTFLGSKHDHLKFLESIALFTTVQLGTYLMMNNFPLT